MTQITLTVEQLQQLVARVVGEVLRRENTSNTDRSAVTANAKSSSEFDGPVLSAKIAETFLRNQPVRLSLKTVVTPSASDILKSRGIRLLRGSPRGQKTSGNATVLVADADGRRRCATLSRQLTSRNQDGVRGIGFQELLQSAADQVRGIVVTDLPQPVVWQLHSEANFRAAQIQGRDDPMEIAQSMQPLVWVIDARQLSAGALVNLADRCLMASSHWQGQTPFRGVSP